MPTLFSKFIKNESGAVTVDWVVLTAAIVGISIAVIGLISAGVQNASNGIDGELDGAGGLAARLFGDGGSEFSYGLTGYDPLYATNEELAFWAENGPIGSEGELMDPDAALSRLTDSELEADYAALYESQFGENSDMGPAGWEIDSLAAYEQQMIDRGLTIPEGNDTAAEWNEAYRGAFDCPDEGQCT